MRRSLTILVLALGAASAQEAAERPQDLASLVPGETLALFQGDDLGGLEAWAKDTALGRIWAEPEMQVFLTGLERSLREALQASGGGALGILGLEPTDFEGIAVRECGLAVVDAGFLAGPQLDLVFTVRFRSGAEKAAKILQAGRQALETFLGITFEPLELRGRPCQRVSVGPFELLFSMHRDRFLFTTSRARMEQLFTALDEGNASSLAKNPRFAAVRDRMGAQRHALLAYADVPRIYERVTRSIANASGKPLPPRVDAVWKALGMDAVEAVGCADVPDGTGFRTEFAITLRERRGFFEWFVPGRVDHRFARYAPKNSVLYYAETYDLAHFLDVLQRLMAALGEEDTGELSAQYTEALGVDLRKDLVDSLGDRWSLFVGPPPQGGLIPDVALFVTVKDKERVDRALRACVERFDRAAAIHGRRAAQRAPRLALRETGFRGRTIRFAEITDRRGEPAMIAPAWTFGEDFLVVALYPQTLKHVFIEKPSLNENADFRNLQRRVPESSVSVTYLDTRAIVGWLYNSAVPLLQGVQGAIHRRTAPYGLRLPLEDLPPAEVITRHLGGAMLYTAVEEGAVRTGFVSPFGVSLAVAPLAAIAAAGAVAYRAERAQVARRRAREAGLEARHAAERARLLERIRRMEREIEELKAAIRELERRR